MMMCHPHLPPPLSLPLPPPPSPSFRSAIFLFFLVEGGVRVETSENISLELDDLTIEPGTSCAPQASLEASDASLSAVRSLRTSRYSVETPHGWWVASSASFGVKPRRTCQACQRLKFRKYGCQQTSTLVGSDQRTETLTIDTARSVVLGSRWDGFLSMADVTTP